MLNTTVKVSLKKFQVEEIKIDPINFNFVQNERKIREMQILHRMNPLAADKKEEDNNNNIQLGGWRGGGRRANVTAAFVDFIPSRRRRRSGAVCCLHRHTK